MSWELKPDLPASGQWPPTGPAQGGKLRLGTIPDTVASEHHGWSLE